MTGHADKVQRLRAHETRSWLTEVDNEFHDSGEDEAVSWSTITKRVYEHNQASQLERLSGDAAAQAYLSQTARELIVISKTHLRGWRCVCDSPPPVHELDCWTVVTPIDKAWYFTHIKNDHTSISDRLGFGPKYGHCWFIYRLADASNP